MARDHRTLVVYEDGIVKPKLFNRPRYLTDLSIRVSSRVAPVTEEV